MWMWLLLGESEGEGDEISRDCIYMGSSVSPSRCCRQDTYYFLQKETPAL